MPHKIFVNLPVKDLDRAVDFYAALGFSFDPKFTNDKGACMIIADNIFAMLLLEDFFKTFTPKEICDARRATEVLLCLSCDSRAQVDGLVSEALAGGGGAPRPPQDHGFMYGHAFEDLDGHIWELVFMEPERGCAT